jgi:hypothetical protein
MNYSFKLQAFLMEKVVFGTYGLTVQCGFVEAHKHEVTFCSPHPPRAKVRLWGKIFEASFCIIQEVLELSEACDLGGLHAAHF